MCKKLIYLVCFVLVLSVAGNAMAQIDPATVTTGHVYLLGRSDQIPDDSANNLMGNIVGDPQVVEILGGRALQFDGVDDGIHIPDSQFINTTNGPWTNRAVIALFNCADVTKPEMQTVFEQGGRTRGLTIYVHEGQAYVGGWNRAEYDWNPGSWISAPINSNEWHAVAFVIRDGADAVEDDKFEMWMDGALIGTAPGGQIYNHSNDNAIGYTKQNNVFHDDTGSGDGWYFEGIIAQVWILSDALTEAELADLMGGPQPVGEPLFLDPPDGVKIEATSEMLQWRPGELATSHNVYIGTNLDEVAAGTVPAVNTTQSLVTAGIPDGPVPEGLVPETTYYWRVESVNDLNPESPWSSEVLSISVTPKRAYDPGPTDGSKILDLTVNLTWTAGWSPIMHQTYFGTDPDQVAAAAGAPLVMDIGFDPGPLEPGTTYYWRVDEFYGVETIAGPVWSFSTVPILPMSDDPNLVGQWTFDGDSGGVVLDQSGHGGHASLVGDVQLVEGVDGDALEFDGSGGDYAEAAGHTGVTGTHSRTVSAWIKTTDYGEIASWGLDSAGQKWIFRVQESNGTLGAIRVEVNGGYQVGSIDVRDDEWHHAAAVLVDDGSPDVVEIALYVDGFLENISAQLDEPIDTADGVVRIGQAPWGSRPFVGRIDDVRIYDKTFTEDEMRQLHGNVAIAWQPQPAIGASGDIWTMLSLSWTPGDGAVEHDIYLGTDSDAVAAADASDATGIYRGRQAETTYLVADGLAFDKAHFWRIDEVAADGTINTGRIWSFTTTDEIVLYDVVTPLPYDNSADPFLSEISLELDPAQDWSGGCDKGIGALAISYTGQPAPGSVSLDEATGAYTIIGRGDDIWGTSDQFQYAHTMLTGDGSMIVKVDSLAHTHDWTKAGIMIRQTLDPGSAFAFVAATGANGVRFQARASVDADAIADDSVVTDEQMALVPPVWLKIERTFPMVNTYYSSDGVTWTPMSWNPQVIPMTPSLYIGLAVTSHSGESTFAEAVFSDLSSTGGVAAGPLTSIEIGMESNAAEPMYLILDDASGGMAAVLNPDPAATQQASATDWIIDLDEFGIDRIAVTGATLVIGNLDAPAAGGAGTLTINNVRLLGDCEPVAHWTFDEGAGTIAFDSSRGGGNDGILIGDPQWVTGKYGGALEFAGISGQHVEIEGYEGILGTQNRTAMAWIKTTGYADWISWGQNVNTQKWIGRVNDNADNGTVGALRTECSGGYIISSTVLTDGDWHHVTSVLESTGTPTIEDITMYVDGIQEAISGVRPVGIDTVGGRNVWIGDGHHDRPFPGLIDDVRIYDRALSEDEVAELAGL